MIKKILVSQPKPSSEKSPYYEIASKYGVELVFRPFIKVEGVSAKEFRQQKISILDLLYLLRVTPLIIFSNSARKCVSRFRKT